MQSLTRSGEIVEITRERGKAMTREFVKMLALSLASVLLLVAAATLSAAGM
ncbi:MAG TPA: hypothetical protein VFC23_08125 [Thermoanaerobaculia bacterium]|nr:hypothetical protein [Thermoanaerobaculia bacterium]